MAFYVNDLLQTACEDLNLTDDGEPISGELAAQAEGCLNRAVTTLNSDGYMSLTQHTHEVLAAGNIYIRKLEAGEDPKPNTINMEPPDSVSGVSRKVGLRWMRLRGSNQQSMDRTITYSYPTLWNYGVETETAPSGATRMVGVVHLNGSFPTELRVYENSQLPKYKLGDTIYLSSLYYNLVLYELESLLIHKYKLVSYAASVENLLIGAKKVIDTNTANNRPDDNELADCGSYLDGYYDVLGGNGL